MQRHLFSFLAASTVLVLLHVATARDLRNVVEPKTPQTCTSLKASGEDDTKAIQKALDPCTKGKAVALSSGVFHSGPLTIPSGVSLLVEEGVTLRALTDPTLYDTGAKTCGTIDEYGVGCKAFITMHGAKGSGIYGKGTIDGRGSSIMTGKNITWWHLASNAAAVHKFQNNPRLIQINNSVDITVHQITLINSPMYHLVASETHGFTVWGITILTRPSALNSDGIDPIGSQNVTIAHCNISTGDDNIAIKALTAPAKHISVLNNHFNRGDGMAIGSETNYGVSDVTVSGLTINGTHVGVYVKSNTMRGGLVANISFENVCISNARQPISLDMDYYHHHGNRTPEFRNITLSNIRVLTNGTFIIHGMNKSNTIEVAFNDVHVTKGAYWSVRNAKIKGSWVEDETGHSCGYAGNENLLPYS
uniref:Glycoside hydrolase family 28 n=1 Tax=Extatosoma tiaratum TaxID=7024 RepID=A0A191XSZ1_EXTTI|nr:glycoside hydrolase family 28 [Extatosoma tiaratum]